jgi:hypothetical protein
LVLVVLDMVDADKVVVVVHWPIKTIMQFLPEQAIPLL